MAAVIPLESLETLAVTDLALAIIILGESDLQTFIFFVWRFSIFASILFVSNGQLQVHVFWNITPDNVSLY